MGTAANSHRVPKLLSPVLSRPVPSSELERVETPVIVGAV